MTRRPRRSRRPCRACLSIIGPIPQGSFLPSIADLPGQVVTVGVPKLSICIATLNRAAFIGQTLESIIGQATDEVEIVVADGASSDNTEEVVRSYQRRFPRLNYLRLEARGGVD